MIEHPSPLLFWPLAVITVAGALGVLLLRNVLHAALALMVAFLGVAGLYLGLCAPFLAAVQVMVYVGAVCVLLAFAVMLTEHSEERAGPALNRMAPAALVVAGAALLLFSSLLLRSPWSEGPSGFAFDIETLGRALVGEWVLPFELLSLVLLSAALGGICLVRKEGKKT